MSELLPQHEKLTKVQPKTQAICEFMEWMEEQGIFLAKYGKLDYLCRVSGTECENKVAEYFDIDLKALEQEKRQILAELRS